LLRLCRRPRPCPRPCPFHHRSPRRRRPRPLPSRLRRCRRCLRSPPVFLGVDLALLRAPLPRLSALLAVAALSVRPCPGRSLPAPPPCSRPPACCPCGGSGRTT
jgi:hypothetical protein